MKKLLGRFALAVIGLGLNMLGSPLVRGADASPPASASKAAAAESADRATIQKSAAEFCQAFNRGDAKAVAALWTADGDYVDEAGQRFVGREAIEKEYARFFAGHPATKIRTLVDSIRVVSDDTAIEDGRSILDPAPEGPPATCKYMAVHVKVGNKWLLSTVRDSRVESVSNYGSMQDLAPMIGSWSAEEHGATLKMVCRWVANKSFIERSFSVSKAGEVVSSGFQIVGWDPQNQGFRSWTFASDGGYATGTWAPRENGFAITTSGVSPDGTTTHAVNIVKRVGNDAITWKSVDRYAGETRLPDEAEVLVRREVAAQ